MPDRFQLFFVFLLITLFVVSGRGDDDAGPKSTDVGEAMLGLLEADWLERDEWFQQGSATAEAPRSVNPTEVSTRDDAAGGCDGIKNGRNGFHTASKEVDPWWQVDLGKTCDLDRIVVFNRTDGNTAPRTRNICVLVASDTDPSRFDTVYEHKGKVFYGVKENAPLVVDLKQRRVKARLVRLQIPGPCSFALDEVEIYSTEAPAENIALGKPADQKSVGPYSAPSPQAAGPPTQERSSHDLAPLPLVARPNMRARSVPRPVHDRFSWQHTREVLRRAKQLSLRLQSLGGDGDLEVLFDKTASLEKEVALVARKKEASEATRRKIYFEACRLRRRIAFCNPLFDFDKILFVKRHHPGGLFHMVHQYYGFGARPGGGLFILAAPFSDNPCVTNLTAGRKVANGRLEGRSLEGGVCLSPDLSFDGKSVLFAYTEAKGEGIEWSPRASFHVFRADLNGDDVVQLTDGSSNDFDPCFLPDGRIVFVSERRGGYLRCGGSAPPYDSPTYTLHSMSGSGDDIRCLSYHETQEWHPSVSNDGMVVYTRWDYIDRDTNVAHHIWTCYPDGRDPRSFHGNYPSNRASRPWMEMSIRAIPNSKKYITTAAAHHGHAFGSLVLIDPHTIDDGAMSQLTRLTPDVPFPESEGGKAEVRRNMAYGTAWPLSEDDYLCVYDRGASNHGIYWVDRFGNRELLYRDPSVPCLSPIPLRPRTRPPIIHQQSLMTDVGREGPDQLNAKVAVVNVYDSDFDWPEETRIHALRIIQVFPKTTPPSNQPRIGVANQTNARAVLGTIPVEADGSAYFEVPAGKVVYFQALDEAGLAVQSMRSGTYFQPGEQLTCQGCHEPKRRAPASGKEPPLALLRSPSKIQPEADGANPFSYVRLVQPVLDKHCVSCHAHEEKIDLSGAVAGKYGWSHSYANLAEKYGFYYHVSNGSIKSSLHGGSRTVAGQFGARVAPLRQYLNEPHYGVKLNAEEKHRIHLWLDCNSEFFGAYEKTAAQAQGEVVYPSLD